MKSIHLFYFLEAQLILSGSALETLKSKIDVKLKKLDQTLKLWYTIYKSILIFAIFLHFLLEELKTVSLQVLKYSKIILLLFYLLLFNSGWKCRLGKIKRWSLLFSKTRYLSLLESAKRIILLRKSLLLIIVSKIIIRQLTSKRLIHLWDKWLIWNKLVFYLLLHQWILRWCLKWSKSLVLNA